MSLKVPKHNYFTVLLTALLNSCGEKSSQQTTYKHYLNFFNIFKNYQ